MERSTGIPLGDAMLHLSMDTDGNVIESSVEFSRNSSPLPENSLVGKGQVISAGDAILTMTADVTQLEGGI